MDVIVIALSLLACSTVSTGADDPPPVVYSGQVNIGLLADLREELSPTSNVNGSSETTSEVGACGNLRASAVQQALAAVWASQQINFRKEPHQFNVGVYIFDTCGGREVAQRQLFRLVEQTSQLQPPGCIDRRVPPIFGAISQSSSPWVTSASEVLGAFGIPLVTTSSVEAEKLADNGNVLSTAPSSLALSRSIISILKHLRWSSVALCSSEGEKQRRLAEAFQSMAARIGLDVNFHHTHQGEPLACEDVVADAWKIQSRSKVTLLFLEDQEAVELLRRFKPGDGKPPVIIATPKDISKVLQIRTSSDHLQKLDSVLLVSPVTIHMPEYHAYFREALRSKESRSSPLLSDLSSGQYNGTILREDVSATVKAVWALALAVHEVQKRRCRPGTDCLHSMRQVLPMEVLRAARKMSQVIRQSGAMALDGSGITFGEDGYLTTSRFSLKAPSATGVIQEVAWYSDDSGLVLDEIILSSKDKLQASTSTSPPVPNSLSYSSQPSPSRLRSSSLSMPNLAQPSDAFFSSGGLDVVESSAAEDQVIKSQRNNGESWFARPWGLVVLSVCGAGLLLTMYVTVFLMMKVCEGCVKRANHIMTFLQLISLMMMFSGAVLFLFQPSETICGLQRLVHNVSFAFCFACLLLKSMYLHSMKSIGLGGRDSKLNQSITLVFAIGIQIAIEVQWWILAPTRVTNRFGSTQCFVDKGEFLLSQSYVALLLSFAAMVSFVTRNMPYSHREGQTLFVTSLFCLPVFIAWTAAYGLVADAEGSAVVLSLGMIVTGIAVLGGVYGPMLYLIHKYGGIPHKPLSYADSLSTVFTMFKDADGEGTGCRGKKGAKTVDGGCLDSPGRTEMVRNPLYVSSGSAYP